MELVQPSDAGYSEAEMWKRVTGDYVVLSIVEKAADMLVQLREQEGVFGPADSIFDMAGFKEKYASKLLPGVSLREIDIKVLVKYLQRDRKLVIVDQQV